MLKPTNYKIHIEPDLKNFTFEGVVEISMQSDEPVREIILNANDLSFHDCNVKTKPHKTDCAFEFYEAQQEIDIHLPEKMIGNIELTIHYSGQINDRYAGFYRSECQQAGQKMHIASTQFEAKDARRAFPCFDQPDLKATFEIEFVIDKSLTGISNTALLEETDLGDGKKLIRFEQTPRMSTYLVFFGIGEFEFLEDASEQPLVRVATTPGKTQFAAYALSMARKSLQFGAAYTGIPYPISKCDYLAVPDSMGAMENFGAIRHAEDVLLVYPGVTSKAKETMITKIIAHESIHMWFGDLVSPAGWKYLWLSEAFATYFTYVIPHFYYPEWGVWDQFFLERLLSGLERDSLAGTIPIDLPGVDDPTADPAPTPSSAPIVYNKGAAILRMLAAYLGEETFRQGLHDFLEQYQFEAASSGQFWVAIEQSTGKPVDRFAKTWICQAGYPIVEVRRHADILQLTQKRFAYSSESSKDTWVIPVDILLFLEDGEIQLDHVVLADREITFNLPKNTSAYKLNADFTGFYRVHYPEEAWAELGKLIQQKKLSAVDSLNILNDFFVSVKAGRHTVGEYLRYIETYAYVEDRYLPLTDVVKNLSQIYLTVEAKRAEIRRLGIPMVEHNLDRIGYQTSKDETSVTTELRETLIWVAFLWGSQKVTAFAKFQFQAFLEKKPVSGDLLAVILNIGAATHEQAQEALLKMATDTNRAEIERIMALEALGYLPDQKQLAQMLKKNLSEVPNSLRSNMINAAGQNPAARDIMWNWFVQNLSQLESLPQTVIERIIVGIVPMCGLGHGAEVHQCLDKFVDRHPNSKDSIWMAFELLAVNEQLRSN